MTRGTKILTHDYSGSVLENLYGEYIGSAGEVTIEDNVYIGNNTTILKDVTIGKNSIISAHSLVNQDIPPNSVAGGVPATCIMTIEEFYQKRKREYLEEAKTYAKSIESRFGRKPGEDDFGEFSPWQKNEDTLFDSFEEFLEYCEMESEDVNT